MIKKMLAESLFLKLLKCFISDKTEQINLEKNTSQKALKHKIYIILLTSFILMKRNRSKKEPFEAALFRYCSQELSFRHLDQTERNQI